MQYTYLGKTGMKVSRLCLGTMNFGWKTSEQDAFRIMDEALDMGLSFFDTADAYGMDFIDRGGTEKIIGRWLVQGGGRRDAVILASKVFGHCASAYERREENSANDGLSKYKILKHCEGSLKRLQTDHLELYQIHHIDHNCSHLEMWEAMDILQKQGKVVYVGSSNYAGWDIAECCMTAASMHKQGLASEQSIYNLNNRTLELEVIPACQRFGMGLIVYSPLAGGLLGGVLEKAQMDRRGMERVQNQLAGCRDRIDAYEKLCRKLGRSPADVALAWLLHNPAVTAPIIGPRTLDQLRQSAGALEVSLSGETLKQLDAIFPGPGGPAPQAYAW
ncbi:MAG: aldo/keto reductase [Planctomycetaceae bacterium]|nr:aldo/keto reductase [Planctomycetaceae bacterium]